MTDASWYVYLIRSAGGSLYAGITTDLQRRLREHGEGAGRGSRYLRGKGPLEIVWTQRAANRSEASKLESRLKHLSKVEKEAIVRSSLSLQI